MMSFLHNDVIAVSYLVCELQIVLLPLFHSPFVSVHQIIFAYITELSTWYTKNVLFKLWLYFPKVTLISILVLQCAHRLSSLVILANIIITHLVLSPMSLNILNSVRPKMATI